MNEVQANIQLRLKFHEEKRHGVKKTNNKGEKEQGKLPRK